MTVGPALRQQVRERARRRCEYCLIHEDDAAFAHEVDHVISRQHGGPTTAENLAYACMLCNRLKGTNVGSVAPTGHVVRLFNPRNDRWSDHFRLNTAIIEPLTPEAEATARVLRLNDAKRVVERTVLRRIGRYLRS